MEMGQEGIHNELLMAFYDEWKQVFALLVGKVMPEEAAKEQAYLMLLQYEGAITLYKLTGDEMHLESFVGRYVQILTSAKNQLVSSLGL